MKQNSQAKGQLKALERDLGKAVGKLQFVIGLISPNQREVHQGLIEVRETLKAAQLRTEHLAQSGKGLKGLMQRIDAQAIKALIVNVEANPALKEALQDLDWTIQPEGIRRVDPEDFD